VTDFIFAISADPLNAISQRLYQGLYPKYFKDSQTFTQDGESYTLSWDVPLAPVFDLATEMDVRATVEKLIAENPLPDGLDHDQLRDGIVNKFKSRMFAVNLHDVALTLDVDGTSVDDVADVLVTVVIYVSVDMVTFVPWDVTVSTGNKFDDWVYKEKVVPAAMTIAKHLLFGYKFPPLHYSTINLTPPAILVTSAQVVLLANLATKSIPDTVLPADWPTDECVLQVSADGVRAAATLGAAALDGKSFDKHDTTDKWAGSDAYYKATITLSDVRIGDEITTDQKIDVTVAVDGHGSAGLEYFWGGSTDFYYKVNLSPDPTLILQLTLNGDVLHARADSVSDFTVHVEPDGGDIVSEVASWVADQLSDYFTSTVRDALLEFSDDIFTVPSIPMNVEDVQIVAKPTDLQLGIAQDSTVTVRGRLAIE
jgi:hypothetical protein